MNRRRIVIALIFVVTCLLSLGVTFLLLNSMALSLAVVAGVVGGVVLFIEPFIGLINYFLFLYIRPQDYVPGMLGLPIMLIIGGGTFALMILHMAVQKRQIRIAHGPQNLFMLWLYVAIIVSRVATFYMAGIPAAITEFLPVVLMYLLIANLVNTPRRMSVVLTLLVVLTTALAVQGVIQYFTGFGLGGQETYEGRIQAVGIFSDPNDLGLAIVMVMPFLFLKLLEQGKFRERATSFVVLAILSYALYLTESRGGIMAFGALLMLLFTRRVGKVLGLAVGGVAMLAILALAPRMNTISTGEASAYGRIQAWAVGLGLFETHPLFGVGYNNFTQWHFRTAHNSFVLCAAELGWFGLFPWVMLIYISIKNNAFMSRRLHELGKHDLAMYATTVQYALIAYCLGAYWLSRTYSEVLYIMLGLSAAISHRFLMTTNERYTLVERKDLLFAFLCGVGLYVFTKGFLLFAW